MNIEAVAVLWLACAAILLVPRRWVVLPLLICACYIPIEQGYLIGPFNFQALRLALAAAMLRLVLRGEAIENGINAIDRAMLWWAAAALLTSLAHDDAAAAFLNRCGLVYTGCGMYFVLRVLLRSLEDIERMCLVVVLLLIPVALEMLQESQTGRNLFAVLGGVPELSPTRGTRLRAQGPFMHAILAGSIGASAIPLAAALWGRHRYLSVLGIAACLTIVFASGSSGPVIGAAVALAALALWRYRRWMRSIRWMAILGYIGLELVMNAPAYYILTRIDLTGNSTSWHRAALIEAGLDHLPDWWLAGTDFTRHWFPYGVTWSGSQTDITNHYLRMGVDGGLPLLIAFIAVLSRAFAQVGASWRRLEASPEPTSHRFLPWALGAALASHASSFVGVSYFDQSVVFLYLTLAAIGSAALPAAALRVPRDRVLAAPKLNAGFRT